MAEAAGTYTKRVSVSTSELEDSIQVDIQEVETPDSGETKDMDTISEFSGSSKTEVVAVDCPVKNVTVFLDQAEVNRLVDVTLESKETEVLIKGLPSVIDENSVRVQCYGEATIIEVAYKEIVIKKDDSEETTRKKTEAEELMQKKEKLLKDIDALNEKTTLVKKEKSLLEGYGHRLSGGASKADRVVELFEKKTLENLTSFLEYFDNNCKKWDKTISELRDETEGIEKEIKAIDERLSKLQPDHRFGVQNQTDRSVSVLLEAEKASEVKLVLSYVVYDAKWSPLYDLRAFSKDNVLQLLYFGIIQQTTGEDWNDTKIALSTALPSVGGSPPELPTQLLSVDHAIRAKSGFTRKSKRMNKHASPSTGYALRQHLQEKLDLDDYERDSDGMSEGRGGYGGSAPASLPQSQQNRGGA